MRRAIVFFPVLLSVITVIFAQQDAATELNIDDLRRRITGEAPQELLNHSIGDSNVSLFMTGSWKGDLQSNLGFSRSPIGTGLISPETPLLFKQEVDLSLSLWIDERWFVEANFLDDSNQNTYRAGYMGKPGEFLQYAGVGNTGLDFPVFPYLDLGGDSPSSFGFYSRFGSNDLDFHALFRYDAASREERVFSGSRERTYSDVQPGKFIHGVSFVLPDTDIESEIIVYIEDEKGSITDSDGRRWRLASNSEYAAGRAQGLLELSIRPDGMVAVSYSKSSNRPWLDSMGSYDRTSYGFLTEVQNWFDPSADRSKIKLEDYIQCGNGSGPSSKPGEVIFNSVYALVIYQPGTFSAFERRSRYDAFSSTSERAALIRLSTGTQINGFELVRLYDTAFDFPAGVSQRAVYELVRTGGFDPRHPGTSWPLAQEYPQIYLAPSDVFTGDISLRFTNYNSVSGYFIGTDVIPGSIQIWRSGIQDANFNYNLSSGEVSLQGAAGQNEVIRITYLKRSDGMRTGSIATGIGAIYSNRASPFSARAAVGIRWNLTDDSFTEENQTSTGTVGLGAKMALNYDYLKAHVTGGFTFVQTDTTGLYRAAGMEGHETIVYFHADTCFISNQNAEFNIANRADLIFRNYYNSTVLGSNLMPLDWNAPVVSGIERPYPAKDPMFGDTTVLVAEFRLDSAEKWTGYQVPLGVYSQIISGAGEIEIPFRFYDIKGDTGNFRVIVQIGSLSGSDFHFSENPSLIWERQLFPANRDFDTNTHIAKFTLDESDRLKLADAKYMRLIIAYDGTQDEINGRVILAPPIVRGSAFKALTLENQIVNALTDRVRTSETREMHDSSLESSFYASIIKRLHPIAGTQRILEIEWKDLESGVSAGADGRIGEIPLKEYRELSFFVKGPKPEDAADVITGDLRFIIASGPESILNPQLEARIPLTAFSAETWRKVTIRYQGNNTGIRVDGGDATGAVLTYRQLSGSFDDANRTSYVAILVDPDFSNLPAGIIYIDEIILEDAVLMYRINAGTALEFSRPGTLVSAGSIPILENLEISSAVESEGRSGIDVQDNMLSGSMFNRTKASITILETKVSGKLAFTAAEDTFLWSAEHDISRSFGAFSVREMFYASPLSNSARHGVNLSFNSDFHARFDADALYDFSKLRQRWSLNTGYRNQNVLIPAVTIAAEAVFTGNEEIDENENYSDLWLRSFLPLVPDIGSGTDTRRTQSQIILNQRTRPVGAIITLAGNTNYTEANRLTRSESSLFFDIPVVIQRTNFNLRYGRGFKKHLFLQGEDVSDDINKLAESINDSLPLWGVIPFYSLFAGELDRAMDASLLHSPSSEYSQYTSFNDHFSARLLLPPRYDTSAFLVPSRISFRIERALEQKMDTRTDTLNLGSGIGFSALNMFGAMGYTPVFKFYQSDEYSHGVEAAVIIPKNEDFSWRMQSVSNAGFRGFTGGVLNFTNTLTLRSGGYWIENFNAGWETPTVKSILSVFYDFMTSSIEGQGEWINLSSLLNSNYEQLRRESLEITLDRSGDFMSWSITAGHEEIVRILGRLNFTTFIKLRFKENLQTKIFTFDARLGTTLRVSF